MPPPTPTRRRSILWVFPLALLLAQLGGLAHGVAHLLPDAPAKDRLVASGICDQCVSFAKLAHVATDTPVVGTGAATATAVANAAPYTYVAHLLVPYRSRGPPAFL